MRFTLKPPAPVASHICGKLRRQGRLRGLLELHENWGSAPPRVARLPGIFMARKSKRALVFPLAENIPGRKLA